MAKKRSYWQKRFAALEKSQHERSVFYYDDLERAYIEAMQSMEADILRWYERFAKSEGVTLEEAKRLLKTNELKEFKWSVDEYIAHGKNNALNQKWLKQLENASARVHISRLESLQLQLQAHVEKLYGGQIEGVQRLMKEAYRNQYYQAAFEVQRGMGIGFTMQALAESQLTKIISKPWTADNLTFSAKIWRDRGLLIDTLHKELIIATAKGEGPQRLISVIQKKMNTSRSNAARLVLTEQAFFSAAAQKDAFEDLEVERYEIIATLDSRTSKICQSMDGKVFKMADFTPGLTANPFHPRCRSTTAPYFADAIDYRAARAKNGKIYYIDANIKYEEWFERFVR